LSSSGGLPGGLHGRQQQRDQYSNDRDHYQKFDQGKTV
jgi:hypothetical protein